MSVRRSLATALVVAACAVPAEAVAGPPVVVTDKVVAACTYAGQATLTGTMQYEIVLAAVFRTTEFVVVTCTLTSPAQGLPGEMPTQSTSFSAACPLVACATVSTVTGWPARPVVVCLDTTRTIRPNTPMSASRRRSRPQRRSPAMSVRARGLLAVLAALAVCVPAHAGDDGGIGVNTEFAGSVFGKSYDVSADVFVHTSEWITGECTYAGQTTTDGHMQYEYAGSGHATSGSISQPEVTDVTCTLTSPAQGLPGELPTQTASFEVLCPLANCATASTVIGWPVRPVVVCVDGYAIYGPTPVLRRDIVHACKTSTLS